MADWYDRALNALERDFENGDLTEKEFESAMRDLDDELKQSAEDAADAAYYDVMGRYMMEWISVEDELPDEENYVLIRYTFKRNGNSYTCIAFRQKAHRCWYDDSGDLTIPNREVTHWQPLPPPPEK